MKRPRASSTLLDLIAEVFRSPVVTAQSVARKLGVVPQTGQALINRLVEAGILREATGRGYGRRYAADEVLRIIDEEGPASP